MDVRPKRICIVGAGLSGLCSIKNCLEESLDVVCYERSDDIGGLWNNTRNIGKDQATVTNSTVVNTSKEMFAFSDFPPPADWPIWLHNSLVCEYLKMYAEKFDLTKHIQLNTTVQKIEKAPDYESTGRWTVHLSNGQKESFDGVMICSGQNNKAYMLEFEGMETFKGSVIHSQMYRNWEQYENKRVLVIGLGNSSMDISTEVARLSEQVYVSTRRGGWIWSRMGIRGWPTDVRYLTRLADNIFTLTPKYFINCYFEHLLNMRIDHFNFGLKPEHRFLSQQPILSDQLPTCISNGSLIIKDDIKRFEGNTVIFNDDTNAVIDDVILCTGYSVSFPFLDDSILSTNESEMNLYKFIFPTNLSHPTLTFIGLVQSFGGIGPISELQGRLATKIFSGKLQLPSRTRMQQDVLTVRKRNNKKFYKSPKHAFHVEYIEYMNDLASYIGAKPNMIKLLLTDPKLFYGCYVGPCTAYTYRLVGPNSWPEARNAVLTTLDRIDQPLKHQRGDPPIRKPFDKLFMQGIFMSCCISVINVIWACVTFNTDNDTLFYVSSTILFTFIAFLSFIADIFLDFSTEL